MRQSQKRRFAITLVNGDSCANHESSAIFLLVYKRDSNEMIRYFVAIERK